MSPEYRRAIDELFQVKQAYGALECAYRNALNDQKRLQGDVQHIIGQLQAIVRDDPGIGGSGGS
jgi:hypothetical protein